jgi:hypothetical protein
MGRTNKPDMSGTYTRDHRQLAAIIGKMLDKPGITTATCR